MRLALKMIGSTDRHVFYGTFKKYGRKNGFKGKLKTILLVNIKDENKKIITTHLWFNETKGFKELKLMPGDQVKFNGRIKPYMKGYLGRRIDVFAPIEMDYRIVYPTNVKVIKRKNH